MSFLMNFISPGRDSTTNSTNSNNDNTKKMTTNNEDGTDNSDEEEDDSPNKPFSSTILHSQLISNTMIVKNEEKGEEEKEHTKKRQPADLARFLPRIFLQEEEMFALPSIVICGPKMAGKSTLAYHLVCFLLKQSGLTTYYPREYQEINEALIHMFTRRDLSTLAVRKVHFQHIAQEGDIACEISPDGCEMAIASTLLFTFTIVDTPGLSMNEERAERWEILKPYLVRESSDKVGPPRIIAVENCTMIDLQASLVNEIIHAMQDERKKMSPSQSSMSTQSQSQPADGDDFILAFTKPCDTVEHKLRVLLNQLIPQAASLVGRSVIVDDLPIPSNDTETARAIRWSPAVINLISESLLQEGNNFGHLTLTNFIFQPILNHHKAWFEECKEALTSKGESLMRRMRQELAPPYSIYFTSINGDDARTPLRDSCCEMIVTQIMSFIMEEISGYHFTIQGFNQRQHWIQVIEATFPAVVTLKYSETTGECENLQEQVENYLLRVRKYHKIVDEFKQGLQGFCEHLYNCLRAPLNATIPLTTSTTGSSGGRPLVNPLSANAVAHHGSRHASSSSSASNGLRLSRSKSHQYDPLGLKISRFPTFCQDFLSNCVFSCLKVVFQELTTGFAQYAEQQWDLHEQSLDAQGMVKLVCRLEDNLRLRIALAFEQHREELFKLCRDTYFVPDKLKDEDPVFAQQREKMKQELASIDAQRFVCMNVCSIEEGRVQEILQELYWCSEGKVFETDRDSSSSPSESASNINIHEKSWGGLLSSRNYEQELDKKLWMNGDYPPTTSVSTPQSASSVAVSSIRTNPSVHREEQQHPHQHVPDVKSEPITDRKRSRVEEENDLWSSPHGKRNTSSGSRSTTPQTIGGVIDLTED